MSHTYQPSQNRGVQSPGSHLRYLFMEGKVAKIRPEPKPVKRGIAKNTKEGREKRII